MEENPIFINRKGTIFYEYCWRRHETVY